MQIILQKRRRKKEESEMDRVTSLWSDENTDKVWHIIFNLIYEFKTENRQEESDTVDVQLKKSFQAFWDFIQQIDKVLKCHKNRLDNTSTRIMCEKCLKEAFTNSYWNVVAVTFDNLVGNSTKKTLFHCSFTGDKTYAKSVDVCEKAKKSGKR